MTWVTVLWPMVTGACITMALIHLRIGRRNTTGTAQLLFSLSAFVVAVFSCLELASTRAESPAQFLEIQRWLDLLGGAMLISVTAFVWVLFGTGRRWLLVLGPVLIGASLVGDLLPEPKGVFLQITGIKTVQTFGGATYTVAEGVRNPTLGVFYLGMLVMLVFVADASVTLWRQGARQRAAVIGGAITFFVLAAGVQCSLVDMGLLQTPYFASFAYLAILVAMGTELSRDVVRASQLVDELKASEAGLRESEARMSLAVDAAGFGIWVRDLARNEIWASDKWRMLFGFAPSERLTFADVLERIHPDDRETVDQVLTKALATTSKYETEFRLLLPDGTQRWIASRGTVELDASDQPARVRGASRDITASKKVEQETQALRHEIAHVGRVSMMGQLASALAHEINQPLGAILRNAEAAELFMQNASPDLDEVRAILADIRKDDERAGNVIDRMRALLKRHELDTRLLEVNELVGNVVALVRTDALARRVQLSVDIPGDLPPARGDRVHLQQVLLNLILNGMDAVDMVSREDRCITLRARRGGAQTIEIAVSDTGKGIPVDKLVHVFDPFFTTKPNGMGMGLAISRTIVEAHGGKLWAENNDSGGATFRCTLPITVEAAMQ